VCCLVIGFAFPGWLRLLAHDGKGMGGIRARADRERAQRVEAPPAYLRDLDALRQLYRDRGARVGAGAIAQLPGVVQALATTWRLAAAAAAVPAAAELPALTRSIFI